MTLLNAIKKATANPNHRLRFEVNGDRLEITLTKYMPMCAPVNCQVPVFGPEKASEDEVVAGVLQTISMLEKET